MEGMEGKPVKRFTDEDAFCLALLNGIELLCLVVLIYALYKLVT